SSAFYYSVSSGLTGACPCPPIGYIGTGATAIAGPAQRHRRNVDISRGLRGLTTSLAVAVDRLLERFGPITDAGRQPIHQDDTGVPVVKRGEPDGGYQRNRQVQP